MSMDAPVADIIDIYIIHYCPKCGWCTEGEQYLNFKALISWTKEYQKEHKKVCTGEILTRCIY